MNKNVEKFIDNQRNINWAINPVEFALWISERNDLGWFNLDVPFEPDIWKKEAIHAEPYYKPNRPLEDHVGWDTCSIYSRETGTWTELANKVPTIRKFWENFPVEKFIRIRFLKLSPGGYINIHDDLPENGKHLKLKDLDIFRKSTVAINLAIQHPENCDMAIEGFGIVPWKEGDIRILNILENHSMSNNSNQSRIHMIAECFVGNKLLEFSRLIYRSLNANPII